MSDRTPGARAAEVPDAVAPPPHHPRFPLTVGLRGISALAVLVVHSWLFTGGFGGFTESVPNRAMVRMDGLVALFFLLTAFLLYRPMIAHRTGGAAPPRTADYARRRFLRLYPPYWVVLTALAIVPGLYGVFSQNWWAFYTATDFFDYQNLHLGACPSYELFYCGLPQAWTLGVDLTFYVFLPLYAVLAGLLARGREVRSWLLMELALLAVLASLSLLLGGAPLHLREESWFIFTMLGHFYWFALGLAIALLSVAYRSSEPPQALRLATARPELCWAGAIAIYVLTVFTFYPLPFTIAPFTDLQYDTLNLLQGVGAALLFLPAVFGNPNRGAPARTLGHPVLMWIGLISFGVYLWHVTIVVTLGVGGADADFWTVLIGSTALTIPLATLSYDLLERPLMRLKYRSLREVLRDRAARRAREPMADSGR
jgi:peptidoglycan/LPS O-acetylase OafA/YrhL